MCPKCNADIDGAIAREFRLEGGIPVFGFTCPHCKAELIVEASTEFHVDEIKP